MSSPLRRLAAAAVFACLFHGLAVEAAEAPATHNYCAQAASLSEHADKTARLYDLGECALRRRSYREAIRLFAELVRTNPNPVFRAELGRAYLGAQEFERAREQFLIALQSNPPDAAKRLLRIFIQMADQQRTQAKDWFVSASIGTLHDSNVNSGPVSANVTLYGLPFIMNQDSMPKSDNARRLSVAAVKNKSLSNVASWQTDAYLDTTHYLTYHDYDATQLSLDTGPHLAIGTGKNDLYLPFGVSRVTLGGSGYSATTFFSPQFGYRIGNRDLLLYSGSLVRNRYDAARARNSTAVSLGLEWRHVLANRWSVAPSLNIASEHAEVHTFDNIARSVGLSVSGALPYGMRFSASSTYTWANYSEREIWADAPRRDRRRNSSLSLTKELEGGYYASFSVLDTSTESNLGLYSVAKRQVLLQISKSF